ncbi:hypothetical protein N7478_004405 [Penicillium angulare]|uniref:uncharacterized protein n=1 Tax=Penicillium angulare TaxID=116970 RepID=UPI00253FACA2|nr:uncharacterized protein N7478_004405 [Penicillium angulare]KAJ5279033.1 hypothetical protein N7478_004405 [Penicillium angulare]
MAQLLPLLADPGLLQRNEWWGGWQRVLEECQGIASVTDQWDSNFCITVDPAISFTIFKALISLDFYKKTNIMVEHNLSSDINHYITILHLQLQQFGNTWTLPRLLKFGGFAMQFVESMTQMEPMVNEKSLPRNCAARHGYATPKAIFGHGSDF